MKNPPSQLGLRCLTLVGILAIGSASNGLASQPDAEIDRAPAKGTTAPAMFNCFPTCSESDGRFLVIAFGSSLITLSDPRLDILISVPAGTSEVTLGVFDGDSIQRSVGTSWDLGESTNFTYRLFADPLADGSGTVQIPLVGPDTLPDGTYLGNNMPNNAWIDFVVSTSAAAEAPAGNFFYRLEIEATIGSQQSILNALKLRTDSSLSLEAGLFSYAANFATLEDGQIVFPNLDTRDGITAFDRSDANYDGTFDFFLQRPPATNTLEVYDGDFDRGRWDGTESDTDDPDTPNTVLVPWATPDTVFEEVASGAAPSTGSPPDDVLVDLSTNPVSFFQLFEPSIFYEVHFPDGQVYTNNNPSGNQEWEGFRMTLDRPVPSEADVLVPSLPQGAYRVHIEGVDMQNLNALRAPFRVLCVDELGEPCPAPPAPFLLGDTVFVDFDSDGTQDPPLPGEPPEVGIAGVVVELLAPNGDVLETTVTDSNGNYFFEVFPGDYTVRVAAENFDPGGTLEGVTSTHTEDNTLSDTVVDMNVLTYDFGYNCPDVQRIQDLVNGN